MAKGGGNRGGDGVGASAFHVASLANAVAVEEKARKDLSSSMRDLRREMRDFLAGKRPPPHLESLLGEEELNRMMDSRFDVAAPPEPVVPRFRRCACGCKAMVQCGASEWDSKVEPISISETRDWLLESHTVDAQAQHALCRRLAQLRRPRNSAADEVPSPSGPKAVPDPARLERLALPRRRTEEEQQTPPLPPLDLRRTKERRQPPAPAAGTPMSRSSSEPTMRSKATVPSTEAELSPPLPPGVDGALELNPLLEPRPRPRRRSKLRRSDDDLPGLAHLLDKAAHDGASPEKRAARRLLDRPPAPPDEADELPVWRTRAVRSAKSQQRYMEARLYRKPAEPPGTIAALQKRLADLQQSRQEREAAAVAELS